MKRTYLFVLVATLLLSGCTQNNCTCAPSESEQSETPSTSIDDGYRTVTFDTKGGTRIESQRILLGEKIEKPADPTKEGNSFVTWTYDLEPWDFENGVVESDMVLEAQYNPNQYELLLAHYNDEAHGTINGNGTYTWGESVILNAVPDTGYAFAGWYKNEYKFISAEPTYVYTMGIDQTLYARWSAKLNNLSVISENEEQGAVSIINGSGYTAESITVKSTPKEGYAFDGWYVGSLCVSTDMVYSFTMPNDNYVIVAKFVSNEILLQRELGMIPVVSNDHKKVTYGLYPQTVVPDTETELLANLNALEEPEENGCFLYQNKYYWKGNAIKTTQFINGQTCEKGKLYWFYCETVSWTVLSIDNGSYNLYCDMIFGAGSFTSMDSKKEEFFTYVFALNNDYVSDASQLSCFSRSMVESLSSEHRSYVTPDVFRATKSYSGGGYWTTTTYTTSGGGNTTKCAYVASVSQAEGVTQSSTYGFRFALTINLGE